MFSTKDEGGRPRLPWLRNNVLSIVAIFLALGGTAVAAQQVVTHDAQSAKKKKKGKRGPRGPAGAPGAPGSAVAFAHVAANGTLDTANSKNVSGAVQTGQPGYYCVTPSVPVKNFVVSADISGGGSLWDASASFTDNLTSCPDGDVVVTTYVTTNATISSAPFYIVFN
jgi:hypothetical protein